MNSERDDEKLESYLRQFRARAPRPLVIRERRVIFRPAAALAAVAAALVLVAFFLLPGWHKQNGIESLAEPTTLPAQEISFAGLSQLARHQPDKFDSRLDELSTKLLPDVRSSQGVLKRLAHE